MMIRGNWNNTSFEISVEEETINFIEALSSIDIGEYEEDKSQYIIYNNRADLLFCISDFIEKYERINIIFDFFKIKNFKEQLINIEFDSEISTNKLEFQRESAIIKEILKENRINANCNKDNFSIELLKQIKQTDKVKYVRKLLILMLFSNATELKDNKLRFTISENNKLIEKVFDFNLVDIIDIETLDSIYSWFIGGEGNTRTYTQKLYVIRSIIARQGNIEFKTTFLDSARSIYQRIINKETDKYFEEVRQLKSDFLTIAERENSTYQSLHLKLMGWLTTLGLVIFDKIKDYEGNNVLQRLFESQSQKTILVLLLLVAALIYIAIVYCLEIRKIQEEYFKLKKFYIMSLMFDDNDFEAKVNYPRISDKYISLLLVLILSLILRVFFVNFSYFVYLFITVSTVGICLCTNCIDWITKKIDKKDKDT